MTVREIQYIAQGGQSIVPMVVPAAEHAYGIVFVARRNMVSVFERGTIIHTFKVHDDPEIRLALAVLSQQKQLLSSTEAETKIWDVSNPRKPTFVTTTVLTGGQWACTHNERIHTSSTRDCVTVIGASLTQLIQKTESVKLYTSPTTLFISDQKGVVSFYRDPCQKTTSCYRIVPSIEAPISQIAANDSVLAICYETLVIIIDISLEECPMLHAFKIDPDQRIKAFGDIFATYSSSQINIFDNHFKKKELTLSVEVGEIVDFTVISECLFVLGTERIALVTFKT